MCPSHRLARICTKGGNGRDREMDTKASGRARSDRCGYLKRTFRDFTVPTIRIYRPQCMRHSTIDEDVSRSLTRAATRIASRSRRRVALASERADMRRAIVSENRHRVASGSYGHLSRRHFGQGPERRGFQAAQSPSGRWDSKAKCERR